MGRPIGGVADDALSAMAQYGWPGNVAELEYAVKRACVITPGDVITTADIEDSLTGRKPAWLSSRQPIRMIRAKARKTPAAWRRLA